MTDEEWGPWIEHDGSGCPCVGMYVHVIDRANSERFAVAGSECREHGIDPRSDPKSAWIWRATSELGEVIRYRIRKPRGMKVLEELLQNLPEDVDA